MAGQGFDDAELEPIDLAEQAEGADLGAVGDMVPPPSSRERSPMSTMRTMAPYFSPNEPHKIPDCVNGVSPGQRASRGWPGVVRQGLRELVGSQMASSSRRCPAAYSSVGHNGRRMWKEAPPSSP